MTLSGAGSELVVAFLAHRGTLNTPPVERCQRHLNMRLLVQRKHTATYLVFAEVGGSIPSQPPCSTQF